MNFPTREVTPALLKREREYLAAWKKAAAQARAEICPDGRHYNVIVMEKIQARAGQILNSEGS